MLSIAVVSSKSCAARFSRDPYVHPRLHTTAAYWALRHQGRAIAARALVAAGHRDVRLRVREADDARGLATDGRLGSLLSAGVEMRVGERRHGGGRRRRPVQRHRSRCGDKCGSASVE
eukprot:scaffold2128_cov70-Phaeocystis_antarctica.AAC.3